MNAIATVGPIAISVEAQWGGYEEGVFNGCTDDNTDINHAVVLVGYGEENGQKYWIVRNSWSPSWGEKGYIRLSRSDSDDEVRLFSLSILKRCSVHNFTVLFNVTRTVPRITLPRMGLLARAKLILSRSVGPVACFTIHRILPALEHFKRRKTLIVFFLKDIFAYARATRYALLSVSTSLSNTILETATLPKLHQLHWCVIGCDTVDCSSSGWCRQ